MAAASQSLVPHAQLAALAAEPSVVVQVGAGLQRSLLDVSQKSPVEDVQAPEAPQTQGAGLAVAPSPWAKLKVQKHGDTQHLKKSCLRSRPLFKGVPHPTSRSVDKQVKDGGAYR